MIWIIKDGVKIFQSETIKCNFIKTAKVSKKRNQNYITIDIETRQINGIILKAKATKKGTNNQIGYNQNIIGNRKKELH